MKVPGILKNKYVFYALAVLAVLNVVGYVSVGAYECLALFALTAYSAHCYCDNQSVAILAALFVANFVFGCGRVKEGFEDAFKGPMEYLKEAKTGADGAVATATDSETQDAAQTISDACKAAAAGCTEQECGKAGHTWTAEVPAVPAVCS